MSSAEPNILTGKSIQSGTINHPDSDPNEYDEMTIRAYAERSQKERLVRTNVWPVPIVACALLLIWVAWIY